MRGLQIGGFLVDGAFDEDGDDGQAEDRGKEQPALVQLPDDRELEDFFQFSGEVNAKALNTG